MIQDYDTWSVIDADGQELGTVEHTYLDEHESPQFVGITLGRRSETHRLVPLAGAERTDVGLRVPYTRQTIEGSPDASAADDTLGGDLLEQVRSYYSEGQTGEPTSEGNGGEVASVPAGQRRQAITPDQDEDEAGTVGQVRDLGDVIEVPIVEEEVVKRPVVKEVLRIRKTPVTTRQTVEGEVRKEDVEIEREGEAAEDGSATRSED